MSVTELGAHEQEFERTPPHDVIAEQSVIGGMLLSQDAIAEVVEVLRTADFYRPAHQILFDVVLDLYGRGEPADAVTVVGELTKRGEIGRVGGAPYLHTLISSVPTAANAGYYARIVRERSLLRKLVETGTRIVQMGYAADGSDADDVLDRAQSEIFAIAEKRTGEDYIPLSEVMPGALDEIEAIGSRGGQMTGVPTGFTDLDALTNGLHPGQMVVVAARPAIGKALELGTPLATPTGWTTMGEVQVGDLLIGADGRPTRVVAATEVMRGRPCYEIEFSDGEVIVADAEHQWRTTTRAARTPWPERGGPPAPHRSEEPFGHVMRGAATDRSAPRRLLGHRRARAAVGRQSALPVIPARPSRADLAGLSVPGSRRALGCPFADRELHGLPSERIARSKDRGTGQRAIRTTAEIAATVRRAGDHVPNHLVEVAAAFQLPEADLPIDPYVLGAWLGGGGGLRGLRGLRTKLREQGLLRDRHIPPAYLRASERQRRALLAGLLDGCGHLSSTGQVRIAVVNRSLAEAARELVLSLGCLATMRTERVKGRDGETSTRTLVDFTPAETVFRLPRKAARQREAVRRRARARQIIDVRPVESVPVRCVQVDNDDHMYLAGRSCVPTHNSTLALDFARAASIRHGLTSAFFSLEMGRNEITMRLLSAESRVALHAMRSGTMQDEDWTRLARRMSEVAEAPLFIDDSPNMSMMEIRAKCRRLKQQHDLRLVIVDYLQLMTSGKRVESRQVEVSEFSRSLKLLAKELGVPVVALSQLNRGPEQRTDKKPMVSDLRESGCLTSSTRVVRADTNEEVTLGELIAGDVRDIPVWALDDRLKYVPRTMTHAFSSGRKEVFRLGLASGRQVEATANHPFLTYDGWRPLRDLAPGTRIAVPRFAPPPLRSERWPEDRIVLLAQMIGEHEAFVPAPVFRLSNDQIALFLRHLWATGGRVHRDARNGRCRISYTSTSRRLVDDIARLLLRFGVLARIGAVNTGGDRPGHRLRLDGSQDQRTFLEQVGAIAAIAVEDVRDVRPHTDRDAVPDEVWGDARGALDREETTHRALSAAIGNQLRGIGSWQHAPGRARQVAAVLDRSELELHATNDVFWDEVSTVESLGVQEVYDATVAGLHNFVANGIAVHNSIEQDSDMVILLHREDAYEKESPRAGEADLIVAKHRNGPTATVTVAFQGHYSRFVDMAH